jgi:hypothetical protein
MIYERPPYYALAHIFFGFLAVWYPWVGILAVAYQILQLVCNVRIFMVECSILPNNSWEHTAVKLAEIGLGYVIGLVVSKKI